MSEGLDWAWGSISAASLKAVGRTFACRYLSYDPSKNLSPGEAAALHAGGIDIIVVWETTASRALAGYAAGKSDALEAVRQANACGIPSNRPIYFAVDFDAQPGDEIEEYFNGAAAVIGRGRVGAYAGYWQVKRLFDHGVIAWAWQTYAWSGGLVEPRAHLLQYSNEHTVAGVDCDYNRSLKDDFGQWSAGPLPIPQPPEGTMAISSTLNQKGHLEVFVEKDDGSVWHTWQVDKPPGAWTGAGKDNKPPAKWFPLGTPGGP